MAKKHKPKKTRRHHSRRMGALNVKSALMDVAGIGAGIFAGRLLQTKLATTVSPKISGAVAIVAGIMLPKYMKSALGQGIGNGLIASGVLAELQSFGVVSGIGYAPPGSTILTATGANGYNPGSARTVGRNAGLGDGRQIMKSTVGHLNGVPLSELHKIGALFEE